METTYFNRALAYLALGRIDQATADLEQARGLGYPLSPEQIRDIIRTQGTGR
jgi:hypothetical protein